MLKGYYVKHLLWIVACSISNFTFVLLSHGTCPHGGVDRKILVSIFLHYFFALCQLYFLLQCKELMSFEAKAILYHRYIALNLVEWETCSLNGAY